MPPSPSLRELPALIDRALAFDTLSIADLVAVFEDARPESAGRRREVMSLLASHPLRKRGLLVGVTGAPGSGKSTLIGKMSIMLRERHSLAVAVLAVDPSSVTSGGALLGDRVRVRFPPSEPRLYFRSQASDSELGGLAPDTFQVCRLLHQLFDIVLVETVGVGQSEVDVRGLADRLYLVLQPLGGDEVQLMKAGILEIPDAVIVSKCDEDVPARRLVAALTASLPLARPFGAASPSVTRVSSVTGEGIDQLADDVARHRVSAPAADLDAREATFFRLWVKAEWGRAGVRVLDGVLGGAAAFIARAGGFDDAESRFAAALREALVAPPRGR